MNNCATGYQITNGYSNLLPAVVKLSAEKDIKFVALVGVIPIIVDLGHDVGGGAAR